MEFKKFIFRFKQFGGWRMIKTFIKIGVLHNLIFSILKVIITRKPLKYSYPEVMKKITPLLEKKYRPLAISLMEKYDKLQLTSKKNNTIYFCWLQGIETAPPLVRACLSSQKKHIQGKQFQMISYDNYKQFVELPVFFVEKHNKGIIPHAHFSDLIRLELLIKYGGTWIDSTVYFTGGDYNKDIMDCKLCFYQYIDDLNKIGTQIFNISNWFISAYSNNKILLIVRDMLYQYWKDYDCLLDYYNFHLFYRLVAELYPEDVFTMPIANSYDAIKMASLLEQPFDEKKMKDMAAISSIHKLDYRKGQKSVDKTKHTFYSHIVEKYI